MDLNDLVKFTPSPRNQKKLGTLGSVLIAGSQIPNARRRPSCTSVGSCILLFGGFDGSYFNDLFFIDLYEKKITIAPSPLRKIYSDLINSETLSDI